ncbi:MAG: hypothetical protein H7A23_21345 [Leptospiraceae bacterium]|nr:hypothetical protein [Leptospiraceae bacterium]
MLALPDNETIFKKTFTDKEVFECFVKDIFGIDIQVENVETEKRFDPIIGQIGFKIDIYAETTDHRFIIENSLQISPLNYKLNLNYLLFKG